MIKNLTKWALLLAALLMVQPLSAQRVCLLGDAADVGSLPTGEQNAYNWALSFYGSDAAYMSFADVASNGLPTDCEVVWFHFEDDPALPASAGTAAATIEAFVNGGGGILTTSFATEYLVTINATTAAPTETLNNDPAGPDAAWGVRPLTGKEDHPIFNGLTETTDWADPNWGGFRTVAADVAGREAIRWWNDGSFPGIPLAGMPWWDPNNPNIPVIGTMTAGGGNAVFASAPGFNWVSADMNGATEQMTLQRLTANMINFLDQEPEVILLGGAAEMSGLPSAELLAYQWAKMNYGSAAKYMSFIDVAVSGLPSSARSAWFHLEDDPELPVGADTAAFDIKAFVNGGGGLLLSGFATEYVLNIDATTAAPTETLNNDPAGPDAAWGIRPLTGQEENPIFNNMTLETNWADPNWGGYRTVSDSVAGREAIRWWNDGSYPGMPIAVMPWWDPNNPNIPTIGNIPTGMGHVMTCSAPGYNWVGAEMNGATEQRNLEQLTANMLDYTSTDAEVLMVWDGDMGNLPTAEMNAYTWGMNALGLAGGYSSFQNLKISGIPAETKTIWFHLESTPDIPASANEVADMIGNFVQNGGRIFVSGFATDYLITIGATDAPTTETIANNPAGPDAAWGVRPLTGQENHPFFDGMTLTTDWADPNWSGYRTVGADVAGNEAIRWWNDGSFPGTPIAGMPWWDPNNPNIPIIGTLDVGSGGAVFASAPGYQWLPAANNTPEPQANLETLTANILTYEAPEFTASVLMIGDTEGISGLPQGEKNAYNWGAETLGAEGAYASFETVSTSGIPASVKTIWYHYEDTSMLAGDFGIIAAEIGEFVSNGGGLVLSGFATQVITQTGATDIGVTEIIDKDPAGPDAAWGVRPLTGFEAHPVFSGLTATEWPDPNWGGFRTIGDTIPGREVMAWWNDGSFPGTPIAVMPWWDPNNPNIPVIAELIFGNGGILVASAPGYHWKNADINTATEQGNLEQLTYNLLTYVQGFSEQQALVVTSGDDNIIMEGEEDGSVINLAVSNTSFRDPLTTADWTVSGLPTGITYAIDRLDDQNATITLSGTAEDYDEDITNFTISIPASEFTNLRDTAFISVGEVVFRAFIETDPVSVRLALVGTEATVDELDEDEAAAYTWALETYGEDADYYSFEEIVLNPELLAEKDVMWFHYDKFIDLPLLADNPNTEAVIRGFRENGGGVFLTGAASQYVVNLGVETAGPNQVQKADEPFTNPDPWGFGQKDPDHPIFLNLPNPFFTLFSESGLREDLLSWWVINPSDPNYQDIPVEDRFHGIQLASTEWDANFNILVTVAEYQTSEEEGNVIAIGAGAYDWYLDGGENTLRDNLELFSANCINYLKKGTVGIEDNQPEIAVAAYPNPFNESVNISFTLEESADVSLEIFDVKGQKIGQLVNQKMPAGSHVETWQPTNLGAGFYMYQLRANDKVATGKLMLSK